MRLLVAGRYVGSVLTPRSLERGCIADVVDSSWFSNCVPSEAGLLNKNLESGISHHALGKQVGAGT
jgi:hypothetical protein